MKTKFFTITRETTLDDLKKQRDKLLVHHPDKGGSNSMMSAINVDYLLAKARLVEYDKLRELDNPGREFLSGLVDLLIDKIPSKALPFGSRFTKEMIKMHPWKKQIINSINPSDVIISIEEYLRKRMNK